MASDAHAARIHTYLAHLHAEVDRLRTIKAVRQEMADAAHNDLQDAEDLLERAKEAAAGVLDKRAVPLPRRETAAATHA